jgi:hypothetical protein
VFFEKTAGGVVGGITTAGALAWLMLCVWHGACEFGEIVIGKTAGGVVGGITTAGALAWYVFGMVDLSLAKLHWQDSRRRGGGHHYSGCAWGIVGYAFGMVHGEQRFAGDAFELRKIFISKTAGSAGRGGITKAGVLRTLQWHALGVCQSLAESRHHLTTTHECTCNVMLYRPFCMMCATNIMVITRC